MKKRRRGYCHDVYDGTHVYACGVRVHDGCHDAEFVKLTDLTFSGCKGCVQLCAGPQVCKMKDDAQPYYKKILDADAVVIGSPVYMNTITSMASAFIERFYGYRHRDIQIAGKPFVTVAPFILRGVTLAGIDRVMSAPDLKYSDAWVAISRSRSWPRLAKRSA